MFYHRWKDPSCIQTNQNLVSVKLLHCEGDAMRRQVLHWRFFSGAIGSRLWRFHGVHSCKKDFPLPEDVHTTTCFSAKIVYQINGLTGWLLWIICSYPNCCHQPWVVPSFCWGCVEGWPTPDDRKGIQQPSHLWMASRCFATCLPGLCWPKDAHCIFDDDI